MRLAELSTETGVSVATLKYYLREGLLHAGRAMSRTQAEYDETHVDRVRLVRALSEVGGLSLATIEQVLEVITEPGTDRLHVLEVAQRTLARASRTVGSDEGASVRRVRAWIEQHGWEIDPQDPFIDDLARAWEACDHAALGLDEERMDRYADHVEGIAEVDVSTVPADPEAAVRHVVLGTLLVDPVLVALRRLAQQHVSRGLQGAAARGTGTATDDADGMVSS
ncbi:transcriptional regulator [Knoellia flava TL1]|uniref:MerR family transcriptional regulator n=2 Tax=Knoellia flava TaxID=913969 RepID=A0A8H9FWB0_9MICO|nr:MerR family transcriptional regulator [Knoellia flava]KGN32221.1 transcriptional regulator [Knoellia flava TL1]GGB89707.1 MerR family transcriptional regulator [Knoellia flava]